MKSQRVLDRNTARALILNEHETFAAGCTEQTNAKFTPLAREDKTALSVSYQAV